jgi:hypothetical protein
MAQDETLAIVSFAAGAHRFAVEARQIGALLEDATTATVAIETLLGVPQQVGAAHRRGLRVGEYRVTVGEPVELRALPVDQVHALPELVARRIGIDCVRALALEPSGALLLLDLLALLAERRSE